MKKTLLLFLAIMLSNFTYAQTNRGFNYKAIITNNGNVVSNGIVALKFEIRNSSNTLVWAERHVNIHTDANGICSVNIGEGTKYGGSANVFSDVSWANQSMKYRVLVDAGSGFNVVVNDTPFKSVPYAKDAQKAAVATKALKLDSNNNSGLYMNTGGANQGIYFKYNAAGNFNIFEGITTASVPVLIFRSSYANGFFRFEKDIKSHGKIIAPDSGDADMKAYIYGKVYSGGNVPSSGATNSDGFTATKISDGVYRITFSNTSLSINDYLVVANVYGSSPGFVRTQNYNDYFQVYTYDTSGATTSLSFTFVVYKK